jgi:hypothetical protein
MSDDNKAPNKFPRPVVLPDGTVVTAYGVSKAPPPIQPVGNRMLSARAPTAYKPAVPVDWAFWPASRRVKRDEAIALSLGLDPNSICGNNGCINPEFCPDNATAILFLKRLSLLTACGYNTSIPLSAFAAWAVSINLSPIPPELVALARKPTDVPEQYDAAVAAGNASPEKVGAGDTAAEDEEAKPEAAEPYLQKGKNSRDAVKKWVAWQARDKVTSSDNVFNLADRILLIAPD